MLSISTAKAATAILTLVLATTLGASNDLRKTKALKRGAGPRTTSITGAAWNAQNEPVAGAKVRLRHAVTGEIKSRAVANSAGRFTFDAVEAGSYVIEIVSETGRVLSVGHLFTIEPGETVATFVRMGARTPWFTGFFSNAAASGLSAASNVGITGIVPTGNPVSR